MHAKLVELNKKVNKWKMGIFGNDHKHRNVKYAGLSESKEQVHKRKMP